MPRTRFRLTGSPESDRSSCHAQVSSVFGRDRGNRSGLCGPRFDVHQCARPRASPTTKRNSVPPDRRRLRIPAGKPVTGFRQGDDASRRQHAGRSGRNAGSPAYVGIARPGQNDDAPWREHAGRPRRNAGPSASTTETIDAQERLRHRYRAPSARSVSVRLRQRRMPPQGGGVRFRGSSERVRRSSRENCSERASSQHGRANPALALGLRSRSSPTSRPIAKRDQVAGQVDGILPCKPGEIDHCRADRGSRAATGRSTADRECRTGLFTAIDAPTNRSIRRRAAATSSGSTRGRVSARLRTGPRGSSPPVRRSILRIRPSSSARR